MSTFRTRRLTKMGSAEPGQQSRKLRKDRDNPLYGTAFIKWATRPLRSS